MIALACALTIAAAALGVLAALARTGSGRHVRPGRPPIPTPAQTRTRHA